MGVVLVASAPAHHLGVALTDVATSKRRNNFIFGTRLRTSFDKWMAGFESKTGKHAILAPGDSVYIIATIGGTPSKDYHAYRCAGHAVIKAEFVTLLKQGIDIIPEDKKPETGMGETPEDSYWEVKDLVRLCSPIELSRFKAVATDKPLPKAPLSPMLAWEP